MSSDMMNSSERYAVGLALFHTHHDWSRAAKRKRALVGAAVTECARIDVSPAQLRANISKLCDQWAAADARERFFAELTLALVDFNKGLGDEAEQRLALVGA